MPDFKGELIDLINKCNREAASNTPDFVLAQYMLGALEAFENATEARDKWYGCPSKCRENVQALKKV